MPADAVYALLAADNDRQPVMNLNTSTRPMTYSLYQGRQLVGFKRYHCEENRVRCVSK